MESSHAEQPPHGDGDQPLTDVLPEISSEPAASVHPGAREQPEEPVVGPLSEVSLADVQPAEDYGQDRAEEQMPIGTNIEVDVGCHRSVTSYICLSINSLFLEF